MATWLKAVIFLDLSILVYSSDEHHKQKKLLIHYSEWEFINEQTVRHGATWRIMRQSTENLLVKELQLGLLLG